MEKVGLVDEGEWGKGELLASMKALLHTLPGALQPFSHSFKNKKNSQCGRAQCLRAWTLESVCLGSNPSSVNHGLYNFGKVM